MQKKYDFNHIESQIIELWRSSKDKIDEAISDENTKNQPRFTFLEGPPTANAPPALHHIEARVFKDLFTRYKTLQGFKVSRKGGWDCHGLPVEVQVEKRLKLDSKKDVLKYGINKFIEECKTDVFSFVKPWTDMTEKMAFWVDLENPYMTLSTNYMESEWWALSEIYKKDLLYRGYKVLPYCSRCGTPLSSHEVAQGYKDIEETTIVVTFPVIDQSFFAEKNLVAPNKPVAFLAWTTTPWTLPSNLALAVHEKVTYALVEGEKETYVLAQDLVGTHFGEKAKVLGTISGEELKGLTYLPLFDYFANTAKNSFRVITADYVTTLDGTGVVHQAPAYGEDDNLVCKENGIDFVHPVDENGEFTDPVVDFKGQFVKDADPAIIKKLENEGRLFSTQPYAHSYPFCWRCATPLIYFAKEAWFIKVSDDKVKKSLLDINETINWYPATFKHGRFGHWLEGARDWALSRNKFWGTPLPIWVCDNEDCDYEQIIGSIEELKDLTGTLVDDLHIGTVDVLKGKCPKCQSQMSRTPEVIDTWFDSGSAPFAQFHYPFENKKLFEECFPYDFISEAIDQTRGWFYTLLVINGILFGKPAYKNVAVAGLLSDENGEKMSKSKGNIIKPEDIFAKEGVDGVRLAMCSYQLGNAIRFGPAIFKEQIAPFFTTLWNSFLYAKDYMTRFSLNGTEVHDAVALEDEWILSKTNSMIHSVQEHLEAHEYNHVFTTIMDFVQNSFSRTYIKLIRDRTSVKDKELAYVFRYVLDATVHVLAPMAPYVTEYMYQDFLKDDSRAWSVHFSSWPKVGYRNENLEKEFEASQAIIQGVLATRDKAKQGVRWPLSTVKVLSSQVTGLPGAILNLVKAQTNIKNIEFVTDFPVMLEFSVDFRKLGEIFGTQTGDVIPLVKKHMDRISNTLNQSDTVVVGDFVLERDYFNVKKIIPQPYIMAPFSMGEIYLDTTVTPELEAEGFARELTRRIQNLRKTAGLAKDDAIVLSVSTPDLVHVLKVYSNPIAQKVGANELIIDGQQHEYVSEETIRNKTFTISLEKK